MSEDPMRQTNQYDLWADRCMKAINDAGIMPEDVQKFVEAVRNVYRETLCRSDGCAHEVCTHIRAAAACLPENMK